MFSKSVRKYLKTVSVIEFNTLNYIKEQSKQFKSRADLNNFIVKGIQDLKDNKELSYIGEIELRTLLDFKKKVLDGKGKEYNLKEKLEFKYGDEPVDMGTITFGSKIEA